MSPTRVLLALIAAVFGVLALASPAGADLIAQEEADSETIIRGTLRTAGEDGEDLFVEGVTIVVSDEAGIEVGQAVTDSEGNWMVVLPGGGTYSVLLDDEALPEGVPLRNPENLTSPKENVPWFSMKNSRSSGKKTENRVRFSCAWSTST